MIKQCDCCGEFKIFPRKTCYQCRYNQEQTKNCSKGVREYQRVVTYFLVIDRLRGASYGELEKRYKIDKSNIRKRILGISNKGYHERNSKAGAEQAR